MKSLKQTELIERWQREAQQSFIGWDFSYLEGRMVEEEPPWSYASRAAELLRRSRSVIDLGTGGGERLLELKQDWPPKVVAVENYPPNFKLATTRLAPVGVQVIEAPLTDTGWLPLNNNEFELVLNRHAAFNPHEVTRILAPGGTFLTQQIHGLSLTDLLAAFDAQPHWPEATLAKYLPHLEAAGLTIINAKEWTGKVAFTEVGAIVYYLKAVPWLVPGFSVATHLNYLLKLQSKLDEGQPLTFISKKYWLEARKLNASH